MEEPTEVIEDMSSDSRPEMVEITLDSHTVTVSKEAADILKKKEHDLTSRNERILMEEREKISQEKAKVQDDLQDDLEWYASHPDKEDWLLYKAKSVGGDGSFTGQTLRTQSMTQGTKAPFESDPQIDKITKEIEVLKRSMADNAELTEQRARQEVVTTRNELLPKCFYVKDELATSLLIAFYHTNGRHPTKTEATNLIMKEEHRLAGIIDKKAEAMANAKLKPISAMPESGGLPPLPEGVELPDFDDRDGWARLAHDDGVRY